MGPESKTAAALALATTMAGAEVNTNLVSSNAPSHEPAKVLTVEGKEAATGIIKVTRAELGKMMKAADGTEISVPTLEQLGLPELSTLNEADYASDVWKKINFYYKILAGMNNPDYLAKVESKNLTDKVIGKYDSMEEELESELPLLVRYGISGKNLETVLDNGAELAAVGVPPIESLDKEDYHPEIWKKMNGYYDFLTKRLIFLKDPSFVQEKKEAGEYEDFLALNEKVQRFLKMNIRDGIGRKTQEEMERESYDSSMKATLDLVAGANAEQKELEKLGIPTLSALDKEGYDPEVWSKIKRYHFYLVSNADKIEDSEDLKEGVEILNFLIKKGTNGDASEEIKRKTKEESISLTKKLVAAASGEVRK